MGVLRIYGFYKVTKICVNCVINLLGLCNFCKKYFFLENCLNLHLINLRLIILPFHNYLRNLHVFLIPRSVSFFIFTRKDKIRNGLFGVDNLVIVDTENSPPRELETFSRSATTIPATPEEGSQSRRDSDHLAVERNPAITVSQAT